MTSLPTNRPLTAATPTSTSPSSRPRPGWSASSSVTRRAARRTSSPSCSGTVRTPSRPGPRRPRGPRSATTRRAAARRSRPTPATSLKSDRPRWSVLGRTRRSNGAVACRRGLISGSSVVELDFDDRAAIKAAGDVQRGNPHRATGARAAIKSRTSTARNCHRAEAQSLRPPRRGMT